MFKIIILIFIPRYYNIKLIFLIQYVFLLLTKQYLRFCIARTFFYKYFFIENKLNLQFTDSLINTYVNDNVGTKKGHPLQCSALFRQCFTQYL